MEKMAVSSKKNRVVIVITILLVLLWIGFYCYFSKTDRLSGISDDAALVVYTPHPTAFVQPLVNEFERRTQKRVHIIYGSTGDLENALDSGTAIDVMWGGSYYSVNQYSLLFQDYWTANERYYLDDNKNVEGNMTRFTDMPSVLLVNTDLIGDVEIRGYEDLLNPKLKGRIAMADPTNSSSAFEHLINIIYACNDSQKGDEWDFLRELCENIDGPLLSSSSEVYNGVASGKYIVGLTFEEAAVGVLKEGKHVDIIYMQEGVVSTPDGVYLLKDAQNKETAKEFIDFITGYDVQLLVSKQLGRRSVRRDIPEPAGLPSKEEIYWLKPDGQTIINNRGAWINRFEEIAKEVCQ